MTAHSSSDAPTPFEADLLSRPALQGVDLSELVERGQLDGRDAPIRVVEEAVEEAVRLDRYQQDVRRIDRQIDDTETRLANVRSLREDASVLQSQLTRQRTRLQRHLRQLRVLASSIPNRPLPDVPPPPSLPSEEGGQAALRSRSPSSRPAGETDPAPAEGAQAEGTQVEGKPEGPGARSDRFGADSPPEDRPSGKHRSKDHPPSAASPDSNLPTGRSWFYGLLYTIAGAFFLGGDIVMSRELVASAFRLEGTVAPWIFAVALAMLAILLKPVYTRLVEDRYWNGSPRPFAVLVVTVSAAGLMTLGVLGAYRYQTHTHQMEIAQLQQQLRQSPEQAASIQERVAALQQDVAESPYGRVGFILTALLFALAGAIALGIGARHLRRAYHDRLRPALRSWRLRRRYRSRADQYRSLREEIADTQDRFLRLQSRLATQPTVDQLRERLDELRSRRSKAIEDLEVFQASFLSNVYQLSTTSSVGNESIEKESLEEERPASS